jgi:hypothetical protein
MQLQEDEVPFVLFRIRLMTGSVTFSRGRILLLRFEFYHLDIKGSGFINC